MSDNVLAPLASLSLPDASSVKERAEAVLQLVRDFAVDSQSSYELAAEELRSIKARAQTLEEQRTSITGPINKALKAINDLFRGPSEFLAEAERELKAKMLCYQQEQLLIAAEARRKDEEAAAAERLRLEEEAAARQRAADAEAARLVADAKAAADAGDTASAEQAQRAAAAVQQSAAAEVAALHQTAQVITAPVNAKAPPKAAGIKTIKVPDFEVQDLHALVKHIAERPELVNLVTVDSVKLRAYVKGLGMNCSLPGVRVFEKAMLAASTKVTA